MKRFILFRDGDEYLTAEVDYPNNVKELKRFIKKDYIRVKSTYGYSVKKVMRKDIIVSLKSLSELEKIVPQYFI